MRRFENEGQIIGQPRNPRIANCIARLNGSGGLRSFGHRDPAFPLWGFTAQAEPMPPSLSRRCSVYGNSIAMFALNPQVFTSNPIVLVYFFPLTFAVAVIR